MKHIMVICHARTGATWLCQLFNTCPNVKHLWEPDFFLSSADFLNWNFKNAEEVENNVLSFKPHVDIKPYFPKTTIDTAVYKLITILGVISYNDFCRDRIKHREFKRIRKRLDAKVIHLIRHPVRWAASIQRWGPRDNKRMKQALKFYIRNNLAFYAAYCKKPWYVLIKHEDLLKEAEAEILRLFKFCSLKPTAQLYDYLKICHSKDSQGEVDLHETIMTKNTILNRWKAEYKDEEIIDYANRLTLKYWPKFYKPLLL